MKTQTEILLILATIVILFCGNESFSQEQAPITTDTIKISSQKEIFVNYTKRTIPSKEDNSNELLKDGNNFIGIGISSRMPAFLISDNYDIVMSTGIQFGNLSGIFAMDIFFKPTFVLKGSFGDINISSGVTFLIPNKNWWKYGGIGLNPELGFNFKILKNLKLKAFLGTEIYPYVSYFTTGFGIGYLIE